MGFEPTTSYLGSKHSTAELHPHSTILSNGRNTNVKDGLCGSLSYSQTRPTEMLQYLLLWYKGQQFPGNFGIFGNEEQFILDQWSLRFDVSISYQFQNFFGLPGIFKLTAIWPITCLKPDIPPYSPEHISLPVSTSSGSPLPTSSKLYSS
jgi:hypothetical protein